jgi:hypothetical protein
MDEDEDSRSALLAADRQEQVRCFPATFTVDWNVLKLIVLAVVDIFFTIIIASTTSYRPAFSSAALVVGFSLATFTLIIGRMVYNESRRGYEKAVLEGKHQEGIFIFPTRDVVVRFNRPFFKVDQEFPAGSISLVQANEKDKIIYILWTNAANHKLTFNIDGARLVDGPNHVAKEMNRMLGLHLGRADDVETGVSSAQFPGV